MTCRRDQANRVHHPKKRNDLAAAPDHVARAILETKGYDVRKEVKAQAARRWVDAVNAEGSHGVWEYAVVESVREIAQVIQKVSEIGGRVR